VIEHQTLRTPLFTRGCGRCWMCILGNFNASFRCRLKLFDIFRKCDQRQESGADNMLRLDSFKKALGQRLQAAIQKGFSPTTVWCLSFGNHAFARVTADARDAGCLSFKMTPNPICARYSTLCRMLAVMYSKKATLLLLFLMLAFKLRVHRVSG